MTASKWLWQARRIDQEIKILKQSEKREYDRATSTVSKLSGMAGTASSPDPHKFDKLAEYSAAVRKREQDLLSLKTEMLETIGRLEDGRYRMILQLRYIDCFSWKKVQEKMHYSERGSFKIHAEALAHLSLILTEKEK